MTDEELVEAFEGLTLPPGTFHHAEHVRVAFAYLCRFDLVETLTRYRRGLKRFAANAGAPEKYHETVTCALVVLIQERMAERRMSEGGGDPGWESFARSNPDLLEWRGGAFFELYGDDVLDCPIARRVFVPPRASGRTGGADDRRRAEFAKTARQPAFSEATQIAPHPLPQTASHAPLPRPPLPLEASQ